jgi:hypothetical protein
LAPFPAFGIDSKVAQSKLYMSVIAVSHNCQAIRYFPRCRRTRPAYIIQFDHEATFTIQRRDSSGEVCLAMLIPALHLGANIDRGLIKL